MKTYKISKTEGKTCHHCEEHKTAEEFHKDANSEDGLAYLCKTCYRAYYKKYYNTFNGAATEQQFIDNWDKYCASYYGDK